MQRFKEMHAAWTAV